GRTSGFGAHASAGQVGRNEDAFAGQQAERIKEMSGGGKVRAALLVRLARFQLLRHLHQAAGGTREFSDECGVRRRQAEGGADWLTQRAGELLRRNVRRLSELRANADVAGLTGVDAAEHLLLAQRLYGRLREP